MATTSRFKQINAFVARQKEAPHAAHLSWMQRFVERINSNIIVTMAEDCPAMITAAYQALGRVGTQAQKEAAPRVLQAMRDYQVSKKLHSRDGSYCVICLLIVFFR